MKRLCLLLAVMMIENLDASPVREVPRGPSAIWSKPPDEILAASEWAIPEPEFLEPDTVASLLLVAQTRSEGANGRVAQVQVVITTGARPNLVRDAAFERVIFQQVGVGISRVGFIRTSNPNLRSYVDDGNQSDVEAEKQGFLNSPVTSRNAGAITMFYLSQLEGKGAIARGLTFCGVPFDSRREVCVILVGPGAQPDTTSHEIAHVLTRAEALEQPNPIDPAHSLDPRNLLAGGGFVSARRRLMTSVHKVSIASRPIRPAACRRALSSTLHFRLA